MGMSHLDQTKLQTIRDYQPLQRSEQSMMQAAVAMILRDGQHGTEVLLMQRAFHPKDPWSGQMAFPGGKIDPEDDSAKAAAIREAYEEVGAELSDSDYVGRLDDLYGLKVDKIYSVHVACFVFKPDRELDLVGNEEVADLVWVPLAYMNDPNNGHDFVHPSDPSLAMPAVMINQEKSQILWGLSLRMLSNFYDVLGADIGALTESERALLRDIDERQLSDQTKAQIKRELTER